MKACLQAMATLGMLLSTVAANSHAQDMSDMPGMADMSAEMDRLMALANPDEATIRSISNGSWSGPATWNLNRVPAAGDRVHIAADHVLKLDGMHDAPLRTISTDDVGVETNTAPRSRV